MINHIKRWWHWQKHNGNSFFYKILVLFRIAHSPTFYHIWTPDEAKSFYDGFMEGVKEGKRKETKMINNSRNLSDKCKNCTYKDKWGLYDCLNNALPYLIEQGTYGESCNVPWELLEKIEKDRLKEDKK